MSNVNRRCPNCGDRGFSYVCPKCGSDRRMAMWTVVLAAVALAGALWLPAHAIGQWSAQRQAGQFDDWTQKALETAAEETWRDHDART